MQDRSVSPEPSPHRLEKPNAKPPDAEEDARRQRDEAEAKAEAAKNDKWAEEVNGRIDVCKASIRHTQKRAMIWAGIALVLGAVALALIVNRLSPDSSGGKYGEPGVTLLRPGTLIWLTSWVAICLAAIAVAMRNSRRERQSEEEESGESRLEEKPAKKKSGKKQPAEGTRPWLVWLLFAFGVAAFGVFVTVSGAQGSGPLKEFRLGHGALGAAFLATALGLLMISSYYNRKVRRIEQELTDLQFERDLLRHSVKPFQTRAEKLLSVNQIQLRRYYELNLEQARTVFFVGIVCIAAGLSVVGATLWLVFWIGDRPDQQNSSNTVYTQAIVALLGVSGRF